MSSDGSMELTPLGVRPILLVLHREVFLFCGEVFHVTGGSTSYRYFCFEPDGTYIKSWSYRGLSSSGSFYSRMHDSGLIFIQSSYWGGSSSWEYGRFYNPVGNTLMTPESKYLYGSKTEILFRGVIYTDAHFERRWRPIITRFLSL